MSKREIKSKSSLFSQRKGNIYSKDTDKINDGTYFSLPVRSQPRTAVSEVGLGMTAATVISAYLA